MDKLKSVMVYVKRYGFWFLVGLVSAATLGCWWFATSAVAKSTQERKTAIDGEFKQVQEIATSQLHPNRKYIDAVGEEHKKLKEKVYAAWESLYAEQKKNNPWPPVLGKEFLEMIDSLKPNEEIPRKYREMYQNFIEQYFPELFKIIDMRHAKELEADPAGKPPEPGRGRVPGAEGMLGGAGRGLGADPNAQIEMVGVVDWDSGDVERLKQCFDWKDTPSDLKVRLAQEDIWVLLSLLRVIKNTNEGTTEHSKAAIKRLDALEVGADAVLGWKDADDRVFREPAAAATTATDSRMAAPTGAMSAVAGATVPPR